MEESVLNRIALNGMMIYGTGYAISLIIDAQFAGNHKKTI
jgi:hypothetical protein